jgi:hypothetical protein
LFFAIFEKKNIVENLMILNWISSLTYFNLFEIKNFVVVVETLMKKNSGTKEAQISSQIRGASVTRYHR